MSVSDHELEQLGRAMAHAFEAEMKRFEAQRPKEQAVQKTEKTDCGCGCRGTRNTHWTTSCQQDPRFNLEGDAFGMCSAEAEIDKAIRAKAKELNLSDEDLDKLTIEFSAVKD